ncbi:Cu(I)-responsive transcriptional regulator [Vibrio sp. WXL103]|uniref:Cu(I)-responsive transcriptional regulator n=1 Tax=Vibrio sp. WXL103 TaxID=3450710 RepID=UPI003EC83C11
MNIGEIAKLTNLSAKSIRLYEEKQLITTPERTDTGYRIYNQQHVEQLNLIAKAKRAGFSLLECKQFVDLAGDPNRTSKQVRDFAEHKLAEVESKIAELTLIRRQLEAWVSRCPGDEGSDCPIIDDLTKR